MKCIWEDLPERKNCFTVRNAAMLNLNTGKVVRRYCANTKIAVVQKCITEDNTYYRTADAAYHHLNYAFEAASFGLPNESAPSVPPHPSIQKQKPAPRTHKPAEKQTPTQTVILPKGGEARRPRSWIKRLFRRKKS